MWCFKLVSNVSRRGEVRLIHTIIHHSSCIMQELFVPASMAGSLVDASVDVSVDASVAPKVDSLAEHSLA